MIRVVLDTNVIISGTLWSGTPALIMQAVRQQKIKPLTSEILLDELRDVLERPKFAKRLDLVGKTSTQIVEEFAAVVDVIEVEEIERTVIADQDDDQVLACALTGRAVYIISGDPHLLEIIEYQHIQILNAATFIDQLENADSHDET